MRLTMSRFVLAGVMSGAAAFAACECCAQPSEHPVLLALSKPAWAGRPRRKGLSPDWRELWTAAASDGKLWIIDTARQNVAASIDAKLNGANRLKFSPDGKRVFISILSTRDLFVYDVASRKDMKRLSLGRGCAGILMDPDGSPRLCRLHGSELRRRGGS